MHRRVVLVFNEKQHREIVFRIKATAHLFKLKDAFAEKIGLSRHSLQFKIGGVEIKDEDTAETLQWKDYDKIFVSRKQVRRTQQKTEVSRFEEQLQKLKETTRVNLVKEIDSKKKDLEDYQENKAVELEPIEKAMKDMKISMEKMMNSLSEVRKLHHLEVRKKEAEILIAESELEDFERSYKVLSMKKNFDCPVCYEFMELRKIFQCSNGHLICENCQDRPDVRKCPVCRVFLGQYKENLSRNLAMEKLVGEYLGV